MDLFYALRASLPVRGAWVEIGRTCATSPSSTSLPVRGAWVEIRSQHGLLGQYRGRSPCGERGLKYQIPLLMRVCVGRRSPCGERGLKCVALARASGRGSRSPCGERGLKLLLQSSAHPLQVRRSPCGERGLKFFQPLFILLTPRSLPVRGAWVEMCNV